MKGRLLKLVGLFVLAAAGASLAVAASNSDSSAINACVAKDGKVSIYADGTCKTGEKPVSWNVQGPPGAPGETGPQGAQGPPGATGVPADPDAADGTLTVTGQHQGSFGTGLTITAFSHEIVSPRDAASGLPTGKRIHKPFVITKPIDKSSPLLLNSIFTNETLTSVLIGILRPGSADPVATVKLTNASVSDDVQHGNAETISFTYQKIEWTWIDGGITAEDDWEGPVS
jgi:type VI secretion system secreted protein Hcp